MLFPRTNSITSPLTNTVEGLFYNKEMGFKFIKLLLLLVSVRNKDELFE